MVGRVLLSIQIGEIRVIIIDFALFLALLGAFWVRFGAKLVLNKSSFSYTLDDD